MLISTSQIINALVSLFIFLQPTIELTGTLRVRGTRPVERFVSCFI